MSQSSDQPVVTDPIDPAGTMDDEGAVDRSGADDQAGDTVDAVTRDTGGTGTRVSGGDTLDAETGQGTSNPGNPTDNVDGTGSSSPGGPPGGGR